MKTENTVDREASVAEDIIGALRGSQSVWPVCWIACYEDRPFQGNPPGSDRPHLLIFTSRYQYKAFVSGWRQFYAPEPLSAVPVDSVQTLRHLVEAPARDPRYSPPPFGLLLNFAYPEGRADRTLSPDQVTKMDAPQLASALGLAEPRPRAVDRRKVWFAISAVAILVLAGALLFYVRSRQTSSVPKVAVLAPPACASIGDTWTRPTDGMTMVCVPAGEFLMGSTDDDADASDDEKPQHTVYLDAFWIDQTEVTNAQYRTCVDAGACTAPKYINGYDYDAPDRPVVLISRDEALDYAAWAGGWLPTEAEWEKAARGTDGRIYPWGDTAPDCSLANVSGCLDRSDIVGSYPAGASPYGALDMAGNVTEWVADWFAQDYYEGSPDRNPQGPDSGEFGVFRGGGWRTVQWGTRCAFRSQLHPYNRDFTLGFRVVVAAGTSEP